MNDIELKQNQLVVKHNDLIQKSKYNLTITQQKLIAYVISLIKPTDKEFKKYEISIADFCELCGIDKNHFYNEFTAIIDDLDSKSFWVKTDEKIYKFRWFLKAEYLYKKGKVRVILDDDMKKYLLELTQNFSKYELYNILALKSKYSLRIYELFKSYAYQKKKEFDIIELKEMLFATHYVNFKDFRNRVLDKAVNDINYYTDLSVSYETRMKGKKVVSIIFFIETKKHLDGYLAYRNTIEEINKRNGQINGQISMFDKEESEFE